MTLPCRRARAAEALSKLLVASLAHVFATDDVDHVLRDVGGVIRNPLEVSRHEDEVQGPGDRRRMGPSA